VSEFDNFVALVERHTGRPGRRVGREIRLLCPAHNDHHPSLDVREGADGRPLAVCRSQGCSWQTICEAIGWNVSRPNELEAVYTYTDEHGNALFEVGRFRKPDGSKTFLQRRAGAPDWSGGIRGLRRVLYRLPEIVAAVADGRAIWIPEGERHADLLHGRGHVATTSPMGAGKWRREYADALQGAARVFVFADDDTPGRDHAEQVARSLHGRVGEVKVVKLYSDGETKRDVVDFYAGAKQGEADRLLLGIVERTPAYVPGPETPRTTKTGAGLTATPVSEIRMRSIDWFERPLWQRSAFTLLAGAKGTGKSTYLAGLAARVTHQGQNVLFVSSEDSAAIDLKPRLVAAGAVIAKCYVIREHVRLPDDVEALRTLATERGGVGLLVIDPVANHIGDRNSNSDADVRNAIAPLNKLADDLDCLLIGVRHPGKDRSRGAVASILGSTAWVDTPRAVVMIAVDDEDEDVRHIQVIAGNRSRNGSAQSFKIEAVEVPGLAEPITKAVPLGESAKSVDDLLSTAGTTSQSKTDQAKELILDILEAEGEQESDTLDARVAKETGLSARTARNARTALRELGLIKLYPERDEFGSVKRWRVGRSAAPRP
jgi:hypothetical protein